MTNSKTPDVEERRTFIKQWAEYVRTHDDEEWSRQQKIVVDSQLKSARELAANGDTDPVEFVRKRDEIARKTSD